MVLNYTIFGVVTNLCKTNNKQDYQRLEIEFFGYFDNGKIVHYENNQKKAFKFYSAELQKIPEVDFYRLLSEKGDCIMENEKIINDESKSDLVTRFYKISKNNIVDKYSAKITEVTENDAILNKLKETKTNLYEFLNSHLDSCPTDLHIEFTTNTGTFEVTSKETGEKIKELTHKQENELHELSELCSNARAVIACTDYFSETASALQSYGIMDAYYRLNINYGKES